MRKNWLLCTLIVSAAALLGNASGAGLAFHFSTIDFPGSVRTIADGISPEGDIVGHYRDTTGKEHGFLLSGGQFSSIDYPGAIYTDARGIAPGGDIVGTFQNAPGGPPNWHGFLLRGGVFSEIVVPDPASSGSYFLGSIAQRITPTGEIYGCTHNFDFMAKMQGFVRHADGSFGVLDVPSSMNNGATPDGNIVAGLYNDMKTGLTHGYLVVNGNFEPFDVPGSNFTQAWDINPSREVVGQFRDTNGRFHGFLLSGGTFTSIDPDGAISTSAVGINPAGDIVGQYTDAGGKTHGFLRSVAQ